jgi:hypothetical protein
MYRPFAGLPILYGALIAWCLLFSAPTFAQQQFQLNASLSADDRAGISVGDSLTLSLTITNAGPGRGGGQAEVTIPDVFQYNGQSGCVKSSTAAAGQGSFNFSWNSIPDGGGVIEPNQSVTCIILLTLKAIPPSAVSAFASIQPTAADPNPGSASYQFNIITVTGADLAANTSINLSTISQGQSTTVHVDVVNASDLPAPNTIVAIEVPPQLQLTAATCNITLVNGQQQWLLGTFAPGASAPCDIQVLGKAATSQPVSVVATIFSDLPDPNLVNNSSGVAITVTPAVNADLAVGLGVNGAQQTYSINSPVSLNLSVSLLSTGPAPTGVVASFKLPAQGLLNNLKATCGSIGATATTFTWNVANLVKGQPQNCTITGNVASVASAIAISAGVNGAQTDPDLGNNMAGIVLQTYAPPDALIDVPTTKNSTNAALSADGKTAVFESRQTDLAGNNTNPNGQDIFRVAIGGPIIRENIDASGKQLVGISSLPAFAANGQAVVFQYSASAPAASTQSTHAPSAAGDQVGIMMGGPPDQPKHQLDTGVGGAAPNGTSGAASVSADGHNAVFCSSASNLVAGDTNNAQDVFLVDPLNAAQPTQRISVDSTGAQLPGDSCEPKISEDGNKVVFSTSAPNLYGTAARQIVRKNLPSGKLELISNASGVPTHGANADSSQPAVSLNSSTIAFVSKATDLDNRGAVAAGGQVFASVAGNGGDGQARTATRAQPAGAPALNGPSQNPAVTCDGSTVVFQSSATNLPGAVAGQQGMFMYAPNSSEVKAAGNPGAVSNANPSASCDGTALGFDSNQAQPNSNSTNSNVFAQATPTLTLDGSYSGQWDDPTQVPSGPGHGLVLDVITDGSGVPRNMVLTWFAFQGGRSTWVQGVSSPPQSGTGADAGLVVVNFPQVVIAQGKSFPLGEPARTFQNWGTITLKFASNNTGSMSWTSAFAGFNSGSMQLSHFAYTDLPTADPAGAKVRACYAGNWYSPGEVGHGFELNITTQGASRLLVADWFAFDPGGKPVWLAGTGTIGSGNTVQTTLYLVSGSGAQFPPLFDYTKLNYLPAWGTATFTFTDSLHAHVAWNSPVPGYGSGQRDLQPVFGLVGRQCD